MLHLFHPPPAFRLLQHGAVPPFSLVKTDGSTILQSADPRDLSAHDSPATTSTAPITALAFSPRHPDILAVASHVEGWNPAAHGVEGGLHGVDVVHGSGSRSGRDAARSGEEKMQKVPMQRPRVTIWNIKSKSASRSQLVTEPSPRRVSRSHPATILFSSTSSSSLESDPPLVSIVLSLSLSFALLLACPLACTVSSQADPDLLACSTPSDLYHLAFPQPRLHDVSSVGLSTPYRLHGQDRGGLWRILLATRDEYHG